MELTKIAYVMQQQCFGLAERFPTLGFWCAQHKLQRGLGLTLEMREYQWQLSLSRPGETGPSQTEIDTVQGAFNIPEEATLSRGAYQQNTGDTVKIVRLSWGRYQQKGLFDNESKAA